MKTLLTITAILFSLLIMTGCQKGSNGTAGLYYMRAMVNTDSFDAEGVSNSYLTTSSSAGLNYTYLAGKASDGSAIKITLVTNSGIALAVGITPFNTGYAQADFYAKGFAGAYTNAVSGSINLTNISPNLEGTFTFTCADSTRVKNGSFSIKAN